jgi:hypothetical protein
MALGGHGCQLRNTVGLGAKYGPPEYFIWHPTVCSTPYLATRGPSGRRIRHPGADWIPYLAPWAHWNGCLIWVLLGGPGCQIRGPVGPWVPSNGSSVHSVLDKWAHWWQIKSPGCPWEPNKGPVGPWVPSEGVGRLLHDKYGLQWATWVPYKGFLGSWGLGEKRGRSATGCQMWGPMYP